MKDNQILEELIVTTIKKCQKKNKTDHWIMVQTHGASLIWLYLKREAFKSIELVPKIMIQDSRQTVTSMENGSHLIGGFTVNQLNTDSVQTC
jgi:hypothetical protein